MKANSPNKVAIIMGSRNDYPVMKKCELILKKFKDFYNLVLATFVRANFNYKSEKFKKLYRFNPAIFFNDF